MNEEGRDLHRLFVAAQRELAYRERCYPRWVKEGRMKLDAANQEIANMRDIAEHFRRLLDARKWS